MAVWADLENDIWRHELVNAMRQPITDEAVCDEERKLALLNALRMVYLEAYNDKLKDLLHEVVNRAVLLGWAPDLIKQINSVLKQAYVEGSNEN